VEPWVLVMPPVEGDRYYASQWDDMWGYVLDSPGSVLDGAKGGAYLIAPTPANDISWLPFVAGDEKTAEAFKYVNFMLTYTPPVN